MPDLRLFFVLRFVVALFLLMVAIGWEAFVEYVRLPYCDLLALASWRLFRLTGLSVQISGSTLSYGDAGFTVIPECDGIVILCFFFAAVLALPLGKLAHRWRAAVKGGLLAVVLLMGLNWIRVLILAGVALFEPGLFGPAHDYLLQGLLILGTVAIFLSWGHRQYASLDASTG